MDTREPDQSHRPYQPKVEVVNPQRDAVRERLAFVAWLLDNAIPIPGTRIRIGLDGFIGLIPGFGDALGAVLSSYILNEAAALGVPRTTLIRMGLNIAIDSVFGIVPVAGDIFDFAWKANLRNVRLLNAWLDHPTRTARASKVFVGGLIVAVLGGVAAIGFFTVWITVHLVQWLAA